MDKNNSNNSDSFFTQAGNFSSALSGSVDPRTGMYNLSIELGTLNGNNLQGPSFPVTLSYSPLSQGNPTGLGNGISLGLSAYDTDSGQLSLSTGEQYQVYEHAGNMVVQQKKLDSFRFEKNKDGDINYKVTHKNGTVEYLHGDNWGPNLKLSTRIVSAAGHALYVDTNSSARLTAIRDETDTLLTVSYDGNGSTLCFYPMTAETYTVRLRTDNDTLLSIVRKTTVTSEPDMTWTLGYDDMKTYGQWVTSLTSPSGMLETVYYLNDGNTHRFPDSAPAGLKSHPLPYVTQRVKKPGNDQPKMISDYTYSSNNFLGYESGVDWSSQQDNLYNCLDDYQYFSVETQAQGTDNATYITRTYNNYHLLVSTKTASGKCTTLETTDYYALKYKSFDDQPAYFQCPKTKTTTWTELTTGRSRKEVTGLTFDDFGNPLSKTEADGTVTTCAYYPAGGDGESCPPEPNGFTRFVKSETVTSRDHKSKQTAYTYATAEHVGTDVSALVLKATEKHSADGVLLQSITCEYGTRADNTAGVLTGKTTTYHDHGGPTDYTTTKGVTFRDTSVSVNGKKIDARTSDFTLTSHDGLSVTRSKTVSRMTGRVLEKTNSQGIITAYTRNSLGWPLSRVHCKGSEYENTTTYDYTVEGTSGMFVTTTDEATKNKVRHALDGMGRLLQVKINDPDMDSKNPEPGFLMQEQGWDALGRSVNSSAYDYHKADNTASIDKKVTQTQTQTYDNWGQVNQSVGPDGVVTCTETVLVPAPDDDKYVWQTRNWQSCGEEKTGITVTTLDTNHHPVKTELYPKGTDVDKDKDKVYSQTSSEYDGWNRLVSQTDELGQTTTYAYDAWSRPTVTTLPDGTQTLREYVPFSSAKLPVAISVVSGGKPTLMGTQTFDGLGRLLSTTCGGRTETFEYDKDCQRHPARINAADGAVAHYTYCAELNDAPLSLSTTGTTPEREVNQSWTYNPLTGALLSSGEGLQTTTYAYAPSGSPDKVTVADGSLERSNCLSSRSVGGTPLTATDYAGVEQTLTQDSLGRPKSLADQDVLSTLHYDSLGRLTEWTATSLTNSSTTTLELDDYGRETKRTIVTSDKDGTLTDTLTVSQDWSKKHQVTRRKTTRTVQGNTVTLRDETYEFHAQRGWLMKYTVTGTTPPQDETGQALSQQKFYYDPETGNMNLKTVDYADKKVPDITTLYKFDIKVDPCQLMSILSSDGTSSDLVYDKAGRLTQDEHGRTLTYDALGRLMTVSDKDGNVLSQYRYDAGNQLAAQTSGGTCNRRYYMNDQLVCLADDQSNSTRLTPYAQVSTGTNAGTWLASTDMTGSVLAVADGEKTENYAYTPYGVQSKSA